MTLISKIYADTKSTLRTADKLTMALAALILAAVMIAVPAYAAGSRADVVGTQGGVDIDIAAFSGLIMDSFNDAMTQMKTMDLDDKVALLRMIDQVDPGSGDPNGYGVSMGTIGNVLGLQSKVVNQKEANNIFGPADDQSAKRLTLETIASWYDYGRLTASNGDTASVANSVMSQYIVFGSALNYMGIDEFRDARGNADGMRMIIGYTMYICFILAYSAAGIMKYVVDLLHATNVFGWLHNAIAGGGVHGPGVNLNTTSGNLEFIQEAGLMDTFRNVYLQLVNLRWVVFGVLVVLFVASITVFKSKAMGQAATTQTRARNLFLRVVIMCIGVPLVGMVYTTLLGVVGNGLDGTKYCVTDYIYSQFLDFENWTVTEPGRAFQGLGSLYVSYHTADQSMSITASNDPSKIYKNDIDVSKVVYNANKAMHPEFLTANYGNTGHITEIFRKQSPNTVNAVLNESYSDIIASAENSGNKNNATEDSYQKARDLILGYARGNTIVADSLNARYSLAYDEVVKMMYKNNNNVSDEDISLANTVLERIFNNTAAQKRLWSYAYTDEWTEPYFGDLKIVLKSSPIFPWAAANGMFFDGKLGGNDVDNTNAIMRQILNINTLDVYNTAERFKLVTTPVLQAAKRVVNLSGASQDMVLYTTAGDVNSERTTGVYLYEFKGQGMSTLAMYNYMHSKFSLGTVDIYTPDYTTNSGVGTMHYSITTPYTGIPEVVNIIYTICILFSIGIIGWVFGMSLMINVLVQMLKAIPLIFKMAIGSIQGFVEALLTVMSIVAELLVTLVLYTYSVQIIDFILAVMQQVIRFILDTFASVDMESVSIVSNLFGMLLILWGTFELIKWRQAITISIKSLFTHVLNQVFGTSAAMPTGASGGMLKAAAIGGAAMMTAGALAEQGTLDDVINDVTQSDLGTDVGDKLKDGDIEGAWNDIKDYANGNYEGDVRGGSEMDRAADERGLRPAYDQDGSRARDAETGEPMYEDRDGNRYTASEMQDLPNKWQDLTEDQEASLKGIDGEISDNRAKASDERDAAAQARADGNESEAEAHEAKAEKYEGKAEELAAKRSEMAAGYRADNYRKAKEAGVSDYATYEKSLEDSGKADSGTHMPESVAPAEGVPEDPGKELERDAQAVYDAARNGDAKTLQNVGGQKYNSHGLTGDQTAQVDEMIANGASETDVAAAVDGFAQENFGDNYQDVVAKLNEANGRSDSWTYGSSDNSEGNARTVRVKAHRSEDGDLSYGVTDNTSEAGEQTIEVTEDGQGGVGYTNVTAGGGDANTVETVDMGSAAMSGAVSYAATYNGVAAMVRKGGGQTDSRNAGAGSAQQVTISEMAAGSSRLQMSQQGVAVNASGYGNNASGEVGAALTEVQVKSDAASAAQGEQRVGGGAYTPLTATPAAGEGVGMTTYKYNVEAPMGPTQPGASVMPNVTLQSTGGAHNSGMTETIRVNYQGDGGNAPQGGTNYVNVRQGPPASGGQSQPGQPVIYASMPQGGTMPASPQGGETVIYENRQGGNTDASGSTRTRTIYKQSEAFGSGSGSGNPSGSETVIIENGGSAPAPGNNGSELKMFSKSAFARAAWREGNDYLDNVLGGEPAKPGDDGSGDTE